MAERILLASLNRETLLPPAKTVEALDKALVEPHEASATPHPAYDNMPSLSGFYRNRKEVIRRGE